MNDQNRDYPALPSPDDTGNQLFLYRCCKGGKEIEIITQRDLDEQNNSSLGRHSCGRCRRPGEPTCIAALRKLAVSLLVGETLLSYDGPLVVGGALKFDHQLATLIGDWRDPAAAYIVLQYTDKITIVIQWQRGHVPNVPALCCHR